MWSSTPPSDAPRLPSSILRHARWSRLGPAGVPAMIVHPDPDFRLPAPGLLWMHGRTVRKEIDPGRGLRLLRSGIALCAVDLPGHGERFDSTLQLPDRTLDVVLGMVEEIDGIAAALAEIPGIDGARLALGGMSAGGMATLARLCRPHDFLGASVEATTGSWEHQAQRAMFRGRDRAEWQPFNPIDHLEGWREIPLQAIHSRLDEWVGIDGQQAFIDTVRSRYADPDQVELIVYEHTGAPYEHAGFGQRSADAKEAQRAFLSRVLLGRSVAAGSVRPDDSGSA